jgi:hypothetical protein
LIDDTVEGPFRSARCYFHLHPEVLVQRASDTELQLSDSRGALLLMGFEGAAAIDVIDSTWHPEFGAALPNRCVVARLDGPRLATLIRRSDLN